MSMSHMVSFIWKFSRGGRRAKVSLHELQTSLNRLRVLDSDFTIYNSLRAQLMGKICKNRTVIIAINREFD